jgi:hypothetical protein
MSAWFCRSTHGKVAQKISRAKSFNARRQTRRHLGTRAPNPRRLGSGHFVITCTSLLPLRNGNAGEPLARNLMFPLL